MKFASTLVGITLILFSSLAFAENVTELKKNIILDQGKLAVMENLTLSEEESAKFWPLFRDFQEALYDLDERQINMILFYIKNHKSLTDEQASNLINAYFTTVEKRQKLLSDFVFSLELEKVIPVKKIFRFLQIQKNIEAVEQYEISKKVPLLE